MSEKYGNMPMGQGGLIYKGLSTQMSYQNELQKLQNDLAKEYAEVYGDAKNGMVAQFLSAANDAADKAGDVIKEDARNCLIQAAVGGAALVGTVGVGLSTRTGAIEDKIADAKLAKTQLNAPGDDEVIMQNSPASKADTDAINAKLNEWKNGNFKEPYKTDTVGKTEAEKVEADKANKLNQQAVERGKDPAIKKELNDAFDKHIKELTDQKNALDSKFSQFVQMSNVFSPSVVSAGQTQINLNKAVEQTESQEKQAESQVLTTVAQKQAEFISQAYQAAAQDQQAADSLAASYANLRSPG